MKNISKYLSEIPRGEKIIYRGHGDCDWELKPSIGRHYTGEWSEVLEWEIKSLQEFKKSSVPYLNTKPKEDIEWLCLMQHHGCATRLLDFTTNPLIALFFASDPSAHKDGEVITAEYSRTYENVSEGNLFERAHSFTYYPPHITERIVGQAGCFVCANKPNFPLKGKEIQIIKIISKNDKKAVRAELNELGICHSLLFPGMDGVCKDLNDKLVLGLQFQDLF